MLNYYTDELQLHAERIYRTEHVHVRNKLGSCATRIYIRSSGTDLAPRLDPPVTGGNLLEKSRDCALDATRDGALDPIRDGTGDSTSDPSGLDADRDATDLQGRTRRQQ